MGLSRLKTFRSKRIIWTNCNRLNLSSPDWDETKLLRRNRPDFERYVCVHGFEIITDRHNNDAVLFGHLEHHRKFSGVRNYNEKPRHEVCVPWDLQTAFFVKLFWPLTWNFNLSVRDGDGFSLVGCAAEAFDWNWQKPFILLPWDQETIFYDPYSFHFAYRIKYFLN